MRGAHSIPGTHQDFPAPAHIVTDEERADLLRRERRARTYVLRHCRDSTDYVELIEMLGITGENREIRTSYSVRVAEQRERRRAQALAKRQGASPNQEGTDHGNIGAISDRGVRRAG